ncbi:MAG: hypothetical protein ACOX24_05790 [Christensenellales bacterium]|jgi:inosine/xanthosine triphosphate pyrophosphatase family protein
MKKGMKTKILVLVLLVCLLATLTLVACKDKAGETTEPEPYYTAVSVQYSPQEGQYSGTLKFAEGIENSFADVSKENFTLTAVYYKGEEEVYTEIEDFSITKTDNQTLSFTFESPLGFDTSVSYVLTSKTPVTAKGEKYTALVYTYVPEPDLNIAYEGLYKGSEEATITATLAEGWKFADNIKANMLSFPYGFDVSVRVIRESNTKVVFVVKNLPNNYSGEVLYAKLSADAINSEFSTDTELCLDYLQPEIEIDPSSVKYDKATKVLTVGKVNLPEDITGVQNGISALANAVYSVLEQSYDSKNNSYSFKLKIEKDGIDMNNLGSYLDVNVTLKKGKKEIKYVLNPYNAIAGVRANVIKDESNHKVYVEIVPYNASFKDGISSTDITVSGAEGLTGFVCSSAKVDKITYVADYTSAVENGVALSFGMGGSVLNTNFGLDNYSLSIFVPPYPDDTKGDLTLGKLGKSAATSFAGAIGSSVAGIVLPYVYDYLGIDTSNPELNKINSSITSLKYAIDDLTHDIGNLQDYIDASTNKGILDNFQTLETKLMAASQSLLGNQSVIEYTVALIDSLNTSAGKKGFDKFCGYVDKVYNGIDSAEFWWEFWGVQGNFEQVYNQFVSYVSECSYDDSEPDFIKEDTISRYRGRVLNDHMLKGIPLCYGDASRSNDAQYGHMALNIDRIYQLLRGEKEYHEDHGAPGPVDANKVAAFKAAVGQWNTNNEYLTNFLNYSGRIISSASGASGSIIDLFFQVIDSKYNFASQTITAKEAFLTRLQSIYLISSALALQYCDVSGEVVIARNIRSSVNAITTKFNYSFLEITSMKNWEYEGKDKLLVTGQLVSKKMKIEGASRTKRNTPDIIVQMDRGFLSVDAQAYRTMIQRAKRRNLSLAEDLMSSGFENVVPDKNNNNDVDNDRSNTNYMYMTGNVNYTETLTRWEWFKNAMKLWAYSDSNRMGIYIATTVSQDGRGDAVVERDNVLLVRYLYEQSAWAILGDDATNIYFVVPNYSYVIGFIPA